MKTIAQISNGWTNSLNSTRRIQHFFYGMIISSSIYSVSAQSLVIDKTHEVSKKVSGFSVTDIVVDEAANDVAVTYFTKTQKDFFGDPKKLTFETYHFDMNYEFKNVEQEIISMEKVKTKYKRFSFNGDEYKKLGVTVAAFSATLSFVKKETTYKWNWYTNAGYYKTVKTLDKLKLKDDAEYGKLYRVFASDGDSVLNVIGQAANADGTPYYHLMTVNTDLKIYNESKIQLKHHVAANIREYVREDGYKDIFLMLQPTDFKGAVKAASASAFRLIQIDGQTMKVVKDINFESPGTALYMENITVQGENICIMGKIQNSIVSMELTNYMMPKFSPKSANLFVIKLTGDKLDFVKSMSSDQLTSKMSVVPGVKGKPAVTSYLLYNNISIQNNEVFINAQNYTDNNGSVKKKDAVLVHLDAKGELKTAYVYPFDGELNSRNLFTADGKSTYWIVLDFLSKESKGIVYSYPPMVFTSKIDLTSNTPGALVQMGGKDARLYYDIPFVPTSDPKSVTFFGSKEKGTIWFGKMLIE